MTGYTENEEEQGVEKEDNDEVVISHPFDPSKVKISQQPMNIGQLMERLEYGEINMDTEFQRAFVWKDIRQSQFIESIIMRLPIPTFYFDATDNNHWQVIDGLQRTSTLRNFILEKKLVLQGLEFLQELDGKNYDALPRALQRDIKAFPITVFVVEPGTPDAVKFNIFQRVNRGGLVLTGQEIRHALHQGNASRIVKELANEAIFINATEGKIKTERMQDRDFTNRFAAFYLIGTDEYQPDLDTFMSNGMMLLQKITQDQEQKLKEDFRRAMKAATDIFGNDAFRKRLRVEDNRKPINKALFEVLSVSIAKLSKEESDKLVERRDIFKSKLMQAMNDDKFWRSITQGTAQKEMVDYRFKTIENIIKVTQDA